MTITCDNDILYQEGSIIKVGEIVMQLSQAVIGQTYKIKSVEGKEKVRKFLFTLGCFEGEEITLISKLAGNYIVNIKDSRYALDEKMAKSIILED